MRWNGLLCVILASVALVTGCRKKTIHPPSPRVFDTPLHQAVRDGDVKRVRSLIASGADLEAKTWVGDTALRHAVEEHQRGMVELLIANGADLKATDYAGDTPLHTALSSVWGDPNIAELLVAKGADIHAKDKSGQTPLHLAAEQGYHTSAELLLRKGADVHAKNGVGCTPLHFAAGEGHVNVVELLVEKSAEVNVKDDDGRTPLHYAALNGHVEVARFLLSRGAQANADDNASYTPLHAAASSGAKDVVTLLLENNAAVDSRTMNGETPLHLAAQAGHTDVVRVLTAKGAGVDTRNNNAYTALHLAAARGQTETVELLLARGASVEVSNTRGQTPLHAAVLGGHTRVVQSLLAAGANANSKTSSGMTPLHIAAHGGHLRVAELLVAGGADVNAATTSGYTPLHNAIQRAHYDVAELLMEKGANIDAQDHDGRTPLDHAGPAVRQDFVALLTRATTATATDGGQNTEQEDSDAIRQTENRREPQTDVERVVSGNGAFGIDLYRALNAKEGNLFFSPYSISTALAMTYAGARENTEQQMAKTLHFSLDQQKLHPAFAELQGTLNRVQEAGNVRLCIANSLWPQEGHPFLKECLSLIEKHYGVSITAVDYRTDSTREAARQTINRWVEKKAEDKIKDLILPPHLTDATRLVLTNAIYFKGKWQNEFDPKDTKDADFFLSPSRTISVPTMHEEEKLGYTETKSLQILEMPYRSGELSMLVLLPRRIEGLKQLEHSLTIEALQNWRARLEQKKVIVFLPKFKTTFGIELKETLRSMGMVEAFQWPGANFAGFDGDPRWFYIGEVIHKAYVDVNEEGTEAAAATAVVMMLGGMGVEPPVFRADHPFLFLIQENSTGSILFLGRVADPTQAGQ